MPFRKAKSYTAQPSGIFIDLQRLQWLMAVNTRLVYLFFLNVNHKTCTFAENKGKGWK